MRLRRAPFARAVILASPGPDDPIFPIFRPRRLGNRRQPALLLAETPTITYSRVRSNRPRRVREPRQTCCQPYSANARVPLRLRQRDSFSTSPGVPRSAPLCADALRCPQRRGTRDAQPELLLAVLRLHRWLAGPPPRVQRFAVRSARRQFGGAWWLLPPAGRLR